MFIAFMLFTYIVANVYVLWRWGLWLHHILSCAEIQKKKPILIPLTIVYILVASSLIVWVAFPKNGPMAQSVHWLGNFWYGVMSVLLAVLLMTDVLLLVLKFVHHKRVVSAKKVRRFYEVSGFAVGAATLILSVYGILNAGNIIVTPQQVQIQKSAADTHELNIALIADMHLGYSVGSRQMRQMVNEINALQPDLVVIAGDIFDNDFDAVQSPAEIQQIFSEMQSRYGVYAVYGNHDVENTLVGGFSLSHDAARDPRMEKLLLDSGIHVLKDDVVTLADDSVYLIGRIDGEEEGEPVQRASIEALTQNLDKEKPIIVVNHEPDDLQEYAACGVDILLSGHTHNGQLFPLTIFRHMKWQNPAGCKKIENMYSFVTQGVGVYGPNMRTFTNAEIMNIKVSFMPKA